MLLVVAAAVLLPYASRVSSSALSPGEEQDPDNKTVDPYNITGAAVSLFSSSIHAVVNIFAESFIDLCVCVFNAVFSLFYSNVSIFEIYVLLANFSRLSRSRLGSGKSSMLWKTIIIFQ